MDALDLRPDFGKRLAGGMEAHRVTRDVDAQPSTQTVRVPRHPPVRIPSGDETVMVRAVCLALATAEAGHVAEHLGVACGELVHGLHDLGRAWQGLRPSGNRRQRGPRIGRTLRGGNERTRGRKYGSDLTGPGSEAGLPAVEDDGDRNSTERGEDHAWNEPRAAAAGLALRRAPGPLAFHGFALG